MLFHRICALKCRSSIINNKHEHCVLIVEHPQNYKEFTVQKITIQHKGLVKHPKTNFIVSFWSQCLALWCVSSNLDIEMQVSVPFAVYHYYTLDDPIPSYKETYNVYSQYICGLLCVIAQIFNQSCFRAVSEAICRFITPFMQNSCNLCTHLSSFGMNPH